MTQPALDDDRQDRGAGLRWVLVVPFLVVICLAVGTTGWLAFRNGQVAVYDAVAQLRSEIMARIELGVRGFLAEPVRVNAINVAAFRQGALDPNDTHSLERHFRRQLAGYEGLTFIGFGSAQGDNVGGERLDDGTLTVRVSELDNGRRLTTYATNDDGARGSVLVEGQPFDPSARPWYRAAVAASGPTWNAVYPNVINWSTLYLGASQPVFDSAGAFAGVVLTNLNLSRIGAFLRGFRIGKNGACFIMERDGSLVATSMDARPFVTKPHGIERVRAIDSVDDRVRTAAQELARRFPHLSAITATEHLDLDIAGQPHFIDVMPLQDARGIDWLVVVLVPGADFMERIDANARTTLLLALLSLALATILGVAAAHWLTRPIEAMSVAARAISSGRLDQSVRVPSTRELSRLARSFNQMAHQLGTSFADLEDTNRAIARFVPYSFLKILGKNSVREVVRGEHAELMVAVMFVDIRGFTTLSEALGAQGTFGLINRYLQVVEPEIHRTGGHIAQYLGDGILALFPRDANAAVAAAIGIHRALRVLNDERAQEGQAPIRIGIGINCGTLMIGTIGGGDQLDAGVVGDPVNLAARVEGMTKIYGAPALISSHVRAAFDDNNAVALREIDTVVAKGKTEAIVLYELLDAEPDDVHEANRATLTDYAAALAAYRAGAFSDALAGFAACMARFPDDGPARAMHERCERYVRDGAPTPWQGVSVLDQK